MSSRMSFGLLPEVEPLSSAASRSVVVVGAGVVGLSAALWLLKSGHRVTVVDPSPPGEGRSYEQAASFGNACTMAFGAVLPVAMPGIVRAVPGMLLDREGPLSLFWGDLPRLAPWLLRFLRASTPAEVSRIVGVLGGLIRLAEAGHAPLIDEVALPGLLRRSGCLYLYRNAARFAAAQGDIALREREGVRMRILDADEIRAREPGLAPLYHKGLEFLDAYSLDTPQRYAIGLAEVIRARGGQIIAGEVAGLEPGADGVRVQCTGETLRAERVVIAAGAWSRRLAQTIGEQVALDTERGYHVLFPEDGARLGAPTCYPEFGFYMTPTHEGLRAAGTVELGGLGKPARAVRTDIIARRVRQLVPGVGKPGRTWLGFRPSMPDSLPVIGPSARDARVIHAFGHGHIGLTLAGITGRIVADLVSGRTPPVDLAPLRGDRFA